MAITGLEIAVVGASAAFAVSIGAHYTGACMGMPYAAGAIRARTALLVMAPLALVGAVVASRGVEATVGHGILETSTVPLGLVLAILGSGLVLTSVYNFLSTPTSTIQILVFSIVGAGLSAGIPIDWTTIETLVVVWAIAPVVAVGIGFGMTRLLDRYRATAASSSRTATFLVLVGAAASFAMGANDVSNASGPLVMTGLMDLVIAGTVGGVGLAIGVLTWGRALLERVAFHVVRLDRPMAIASQWSQSVVILASVAVGYFTSMNQALVGAMIGSGLARRQTLEIWPSIRGILAGWALGPVSGAIVGFVFAALAIRAGIA